MTIFIGKTKTTEKCAMEFISEQHNFVRQIVRAWCQSKIDHHFKNDKRFRKAVQKNQAVLHSHGAIEALFTSSNYAFSTKAKDRKETLFEDGGTNRTGRLRQPHPKGPLARIDRKSRIRRFLSQRRLECVKEWHDKHKHRLPCFYISEEVPKNGKHLIEFVCEKKRLSAWHPSAGTTKMSKHDLDHRIGPALENILGISHGKSH